MQDHLLIYVIVVLNAFCQLLLIWSLKKLGNKRFHFMAAAILLPLFTAIFMRGMVATGLIHGHLADQSQFEQILTKVTGGLLVAAPWLTTLAAILYRRRMKIALNT
ncbi:MAG: hypothetical protein HXX17_03405 [Geobacteraceae bacterium]|nr:hypothetical protein [Geobacteraceae bacterium]